MNIKNGTKTSQKISLLNALPKLTIYWVAFFLLLSFGQQTVFQTTNQNRSAQHSST